MPQPLSYKGLDIYLDVVGVGVVVQCCCCQHAYMQYQKVGAHACAHTHTCTHTLTHARAHTRSVLHLMMMVMMTV